MLKIHDKLPENFTELKPYELHQHFEALDLIELPGGTNDTSPLFVSFMLHGNECSGLSVVQRIINKYKDKKLPRPLIIMIGNVKASKDGVRTVEGGPDMNRIWKNRTHTLLEKKAEAILDYLKTKKLFAAVDIHNNTGENPPYACINKLDLQIAHIAKMFSGVSVYFREPATALSVAMCEFCPAVTLECGKPMDPVGAENAYDLINELLHKEVIPNEMITDEELSIYHSFATVKIPSACQIAYGEASNTDVDFCFKGNLDSYNFTTVKVGEIFGIVNNPEARLEVTNDKGEDLSDIFFEYENHRISVKKSFVPSMISCVVPVVKQDCLCYLMESYSTQMLK